MSATIKLLDKYKQVCSLSSDSACADSLGVTRGAVHLWKKGSSHPDAVSVEKMCNAIKEPLRSWLPLIEAERAHSPAAKKVWLRLAQAAAAVALTIGVMPTHAAAVETLRAAALSGPHDFAPVYIMRNWMRRILDGMKHAFTSAHRNGLHACAGNAPA